MRKVKYLLGMLVMMLCLTAVPAGAAELTLEQDENKTVISGGFSYEIIPLEDEEVPVGWKEITLVLYGTEVTAYKSEDGIDDFYLLYCETEEGIKGFYLYDEQEKTIQRYQATLTHFSDDQNEGMTAQQYNDRVTLLAGVTAAACAVATIALAGVIKLQLKLRKENDDYFY